MNRWYTRPDVVMFLLPAAVLIEIAHDLLAITHAVMTADSVLLPGAISRTLLMGSLGMVAILRKSRWARWVFAGFQYATAAVTTLFTFVTVPGGQLTFEPVMFALSVGYLLLGLAATFGAVKPSERQAST